MTSSILSSQISDLQLPVRCWQQEQSDSSETWRKRRDRRPKRKQDHPNGQPEIPVRFLIDPTSMRVLRAVQIRWLKRRSSLLPQRGAKQPHKSILLARTRRTCPKTNEEQRSLRRGSKKRLAGRLMRIESHANRSLQAASKEHSSRCLDKGKKNTIS